MPNDLQPDDLKKLIKLKAALKSDGEFSPDEIQTALDEATRQLRAKNESIMGKYIQPAADKYRNKIAPATTNALAKAFHAAGPGLAGPLGILAAGHPNVQQQPGPLAQFAAQQIVPPDLTSAGIDVAMLATQAGPVAKVFRGLPAFVRLLGEYGAPMTAGRIMAPLDQRTPAEGEFQAATQVGGGKVLAGAMNLLGATTSKTDAERVTKDVGAYMKQTLPHYQGKLETARDWAYAFARKGPKNAKQQVGQALNSAERSLSTQLGNTKLTIPTLKDALVNMGSDPDKTPDQFTFLQAMRIYRKIRNRAYLPTGGVKEGADFAHMRELRGMLHSARGEMIDEMELANPGSGSMWDSLLREDAATHVYSNLMHDLQKAGITEGQLPVRDLQLLLSNGGEGGYAEDLDMIFGNPSTTDGLIIASQRNAMPYTGVDEKTLRESLRIYGNPIKPEGLHFGLPAKFLSAGKRTGDATRRFPKMSGAVPGILLQQLGEKAGEVEAPATPFEGEPVDIPAPR